MWSVIHIVSAAKDCKSRQDESQLPSSNGLLWSSKQLMYSSQTAQQVIHEQADCAVGSPLIAEAPCKVVAQSVSASKPVEVSKLMAAQRGQHSPAQTHTGTRSCSQRTCGSIRDGSLHPHLAPLHALN